MLMVCCEPEGLKQEKVIESLIFKIAETSGHRLCSELGTNMCYQF